MRAFHQEQESRLTTGTSTEHTVDRHGSNLQHGTCSLLECNSHILLYVEGVSLLIWRVQESLLGKLLVRIEVILMIR